MSTRERVSASSLAAVVGFGVCAWIVWIEGWLGLRFAVLGSLLSAGVFAVAMLFPGVVVRRGPPVAPPRGELALRRPVWMLMSELYLDRELDEADYVQIVQSLRACGYTPAELDQILYREVHPFLVPNLLSVAGEWTGFDIGWIEERILRRRPRYPRVALVPGYWAIRDEWVKIRRAIVEAG